MTQRWKLFAAGLVVLLLFGAVTATLCSTRETFSGSRVKNPDAYLLDIQRMNGTDLHTLELLAGDVLRIHFDTQQGELYMELKAPDGTTIYRGNGKDTKDFTLNIPQSGVYPVVVEARWARGTIHIEAKEKSS